MLKVVCVCANGMGTSTILKLNIKSVADAEGVKLDVSSCAFGEAMAHVGGADIIVTSPEWAEQIPENNAEMVVVKNLVDKKEVGDALIDAIKTHFPEEIK
ncbi:MAG: PTS sugar transporter subunit IIB [Clostridiaceae bacterium]|nr:PTS sugar transporter subunit IIB [Bacillota bacterium]NLN52591.1 PTS sugar transporter subunit IIB [Clostridiaceae bacterium]